MENKEMPFADMYKLFLPAYEHVYTHQLGRLRDFKADIGDYALLPAWSAFKGLLYTAPVLLADSFEVIEISQKAKIGIATTCILGNLAINFGAYLTGAVRGNKTMSEQKKKDLVDFLTDPID